MDPPTRPCVRADPESIYEPDRNPRGSILNLSRHNSLTGPFSGRGRPAVGGLASTRHRVATAAGDRRPTTRRNRNPQIAPRVVASANISPAKTGLSS